MNNKLEKYISELNELIQLEIKSLSILEQHIAVKMYWRAILAVCMLVSYGVAMTCMIASYIIPAIIFIFIMGAILFVERNLRISGNEHKYNETRKFKHAWMNLSRDMYKLELFISCGAEPIIIFRYYCGIMQRVYAIRQLM